MKISTENRDQLSMHYWLIFMRVLYRVIYSNVVGFFALMSAVPLMVILVQFWDKGYSYISQIVISIIYWPLILQGETEFDAQDTIFVVAVWSLIFSGITVILQKLHPKRRNRSGRGFQIIHVIFIALYLAALLLLTLLPVSNNTEKSSGYGVLIFFFILGYGTFWVARTMNWLRLNLKRSS